LRDDAEALEPQMADERVEHRELAFERHRLTRPPAVGHPTAETVVADHLLAGG
jgi:hypothetical protein